MALLDGIRRRFAPLRTLRRDPVDLCDRIIPICGDIVSTGQR
jgi:hypothetical protein